MRTSASSGVSSGKKNTPETPYYITLIDLVIQLKRVATRIGLTERIEFIFDEQMMEKRQIRDAWDGIKITRPDIAAHLGNEPRFEKDDDFLPLQAADKLAWW